MDVFLKPIITEKMTAEAESLNRFGFVVDKSANKVCTSLALTSLSLIKYFDPLSFSIFLFTDISSNSLY